MNEQTVHVHLELRVAGDALSGRAVYGAGGSRRFSGFIGLVAAIDAVVEEAREGRLQLHPENAPVHAQKETDNAGH
jgi:hypothetical protein